MVEVKVGDIINLSTAKSGANEKGSWMYVRQKADQGNEEITVFLHDKCADDARYWKTGKIKTIRKVTRQSRQHNGRWYTNVIVDAEMIEGPLTEAITPDTSFMEVPPDDLDGLPFA